MAALLFYKGTKLENSSSTFLDRVICFFTGSQFSHVELSLSNVGFTHTTISSSSRDGGVRIATINVDDGHWYIIELRNDVSFEYIGSALGKRYDYIGLFGALFKVGIFNSKTKWFCSELIATSLKIDKPWAQTPESLFNYSLRNLNAN